MFFLRHFHWECKGEVPSSHGVSQGRIKDYGGPRRLNGTGVVDVCIAGIGDSIYGDSRQSGNREQWTIGDEGKWD